jgi:hypothetical protein
MRWKDWRKFNRLPWTDQWVLAEAVVLLPLAAVSLRVLSFARVHAVLSALPKANRPPLHPERVATVARLLRSANDAWFTRVTCLPHSLVLWWLLRRRGTDAVLRFGVRKTTGEIEAHAWVEHAGVALNDDADVHERFAPFDRAIAG